MNGRVQTGELVGRWMMVRWIDGWMDRWMGG